ncbi:MAG TPA: AMP-binding protein [Verrucomicrobiales bacterium]|nr:AMP-binding protein [Verrucomicrobiales bacterium]
MIPSSFETINDLLLTRRDQQPSALAYRFLGSGETETETISYADLAEEALRVAAALHRVGLKQGDRALLLFPAGIRYIAAFLGSLLAGVAAVPAYPPRPNRRDPRLLAIIRDAGARAVLTTTALQANVQERLGELGADSAPLCLASDNIEDAPLANPVAAGSSGLAFLQYTSGSTGSPKGVMVRHGNIVDNLAFIREAFSLHPESRCLSWLPPFHDMGLIDGILEPLYLGSTGVLMPPTAFLQRPARWLQAISDYRIAHSGGPDFGYLLCAEKVDPAAIDGAGLSCWESAYSGAEPVRPSTLDRFCQRFASLGFARRAFYPCYGLAEATLMVSGGSVDSDPVLRSFDASTLTTAQRAEPSHESGARAILLPGVGHARRDTRIVVADPDTLLPRPERVIGEILVHGGGVASGYWNQPEESLAVFGAAVPGYPGKTFLRTGDLGFLDQGELFVTGRSKDLIIVRGENHYPQDLELTVENAHFAVRKGCVAAFTVDDEHGEQLVLVAEVERTALRNLDAVEVATVIREAISLEYELLARSIVLIRTGTIPRTSSGKIRRSACRQDWLDGALQEAGRSDLTQTAPLTNGEDSALPHPGGPFEVRPWLVSRLAHHLHLSPELIDHATPFAQYGLDSSVALGITGELQDELGVELPPTLLWDYPTIDDVTFHVDAELGRLTPS